MSLDPVQDDVLLKLQEARRSVNQIALFNGVLRQPVVAELINLLSATLHNEAGDAIDVARYRFLGMLAEAVTASDLRLFSASSSLTGWQRYFLERVLEDENAFTLLAERGLLPLPHGLTTLAAHDLRCLQRIFSLPHDLSSLIDPDGVIPSLVPTVETDTDLGLPSPLVDGIRSVCDALHAADDWGTCVDLLAEHVARVGAGVFGRYVAFRWDETMHGDDAVNEQMGSPLVPIENPDLVDIRHLIEYESERQLVLRNTEKLIQGLPAQNVLLYGDRGTGKSATVKAMLHTFAADGLRMIEVPRSALSDLPRVLHVVRQRHRPTILFIDDLSFEEGDVAYKELKAVLEGTLEGRPRHVLVYATSNRRHLIQEQFADRRRPSDSGEVNPQDTLQEKLSLADRFGITVIFPSPSQARYLSIVEGIARQRGLAVPAEELKRQALQWATWHNGRSARTAQQFIDHLVGEKELEPDPHVG